MYTELKRMPHCRPWRLVLDERSRSELPRAGSWTTRLCHSSSSSHEGLHVHHQGAGGGVGGGRGRRRARGVAWEVDGGDVVDAGPPLVLAAGAEPDEVLLRVAGHLRRRPGRHVLARDVPPVPSPVLPQPHQEKLVLLLRPGDTLLPLLHLLRAARAPEPAVAAAPVLEGEPGRRRDRAAVARERHEPAGLDDAHVLLEGVVVAPHVVDRLPGQHRRHLLPPVRRVPVDLRQRLLEQLVLLRRPRVSSPPQNRVRVLLPEAGRRRRQQHRRPRLRHHLGSEEDEGESE
uniref:Uncharacterized protein n=1 Tax=Zea mays TaxID=4577 RepID=B7ZYZ1_MAIZE|nr:unknown [Zea mays]